MFKLKQSQLKELKLGEDEQPGPEWDHWTKNTTVEEQFSALNALASAIDKGETPPESVPRWDQIVPEELWRKRLENARQEIALRSRRCTTPVYVALQNKQLQHPSPLESEQTRVDYYAYDWQSLSADAARGVIQKIDENAIPLSDVKGCDFYRNITWKKSGDKGLEAMYARFLEHPEDGQPEAVKELVESNILRVNPTKISEASGDSREPMRAQLGSASRDWYGFDFRRPSRKLAWKGETPDNIASVGITINIGEDAAKAYMYIHEQHGMEIDSKDLAPYEKELLALNLSSHQPYKFSRDSSDVNRALIFDKEGERIYDSSGQQKSLDISTKSRGPLGSFVVEGFSRFDKRKISELLFIGNEYRIEEVQKFSYKSDVFIKKEDNENFESLKGELGFPQASESLYLSYDNPQDPKICTVQVDNLPRRYQYTKKKDAHNPSRSLIEDAHKYSLISDRIQASPDRDHYEFFITASRQRERGNRSGDQPLIPGISGTAQASSRSGDLRGVTLQNILETSGSSRTSDQGERLGRKDGSRSRTPSPSARLR